MAIHFDVRKSKVSPMFPKYSTESFQICHVLILKTFALLSFLFFPMLNTDQMTKHSGTACICANSPPNANAAQRFFMVPICNVFFLPTRFTFCFRTVLSLLYSFISFKAEIVK